MSTEKHKMNFFLCCFCGIKIQANRYNLDEHEKLHSSHVSKIKCAAKNCNSHFANKCIYWKHWKNKHSGLTMPDFLIYVDVPAQQNRRGRPARPGGQARKVKKVNKNRATRATKLAMTAHTAASNGCKNDGAYPACHIKSTEEPKDFLKFNFENTIEDCLLRDPFFGCLKWHSD